MKIIKKFGREDLATVYMAETGAGRLVEFVESVQPPLSRDQKWVMIVSTLYGCPVECEMCDAGGSYQGKLETEDILAQIDYMICKYYPGRKVPVKKFKIQFSRMGEPALNKGVLEVLEKLPFIYEAPGLMPALSTVAPCGCDDFFERLLKIKNEYYPRRFQLQFSIHSTNEAERDRIIPTKKWGLAKIAEYGARFYKSGGRKITLNFVLADGYTIDPSKLRSIFSPETFFIKITPLNPNCRVHDNGLKSALSKQHLNGEEMPEIADQLEEMGYEALVSIGELEENLIGSNCGQYIRTFEEYIKRGNRLEDSYNLLYNFPSPLRLRSGQAHPSPQRGEEILGVDI